MNIFLRLLFITLTTSTISPLFSADAEKKDATKKPGKGMETGILVPDDSENRPERKAFRKIEETLIRNLERAKAPLQLAKFPVNTLNLASLYVQNTINGYQIHLTNNPTEKARKHCEKLIALYTTHKVAIEQAIKTKQQQEEEFFV